MQLQITKNKNRSLSNRSSFVIQNSKSRGGKLVQCPKDATGGSGSFLMLNSTIFSVEVSIFILSAS